MCSTIAVLVQIVSLMSWHQGGQCIELPSSIERCSIKDEKCMVKQANAFLRKHPHGLPEVGIPDLDPLHLDEINIVGDEKSAANINLYIKDAHFHNFSAMNITKIHFNDTTKDLSKPRMLTINQLLSGITLKAKYKVSGKIVLLPIAGDGDMEWNITGIKAQTKMVLSSEQRDGKTHFQVVGYKFMTKISGSVLDLTNLFNNDKELGDNILKFINENWQQLDDEIRPKMDLAIQESNRAFMTRFFQLIPVEYLFLQDP